MSQNPDLKQYEEVYKEIGKLLIARDLSPLAAMAILGTMSESLFQYSMLHPAVFQDEKALAEILELQGDER